MRMPDSSLSVAYNILFSGICALLSYIFNTRVRRHRLTIGRLTLFSAHDIHYDASVAHKTYTFSFKASSLTWRFHFPRPTDPRWCTVAFTSVYYTSSTGDISTALFEVVLWFFPVFFSQTAGPWANITIDDLRIKVFKSVQTPYYIQLLRQNLVGTLLNGEVFRSDVFRTSIRFAGLSERAEETSNGCIDANRKLSSDSPDDSDPQDYTEDDVAEVSSESASESISIKLNDADEDEDFGTKPLRTYQDDEMTFEVLARQLHINNTEGHIYTFGSIDSQMRRDWAQDRGSLAMVATECRWVHVHFPFERVARRHWFTQLCSSMFHFPIDLVRTFNYPASSTNIYVRRLDVTFDSFRLRDAELFKQGASLIREKMTASGVHWSDVFFDALTASFAQK